MQGSNNNQRYYEIDLLRFLSALMVVLFHYTYVSARDGSAVDMDFHSYAGWGHYLYIGINFFFVISGFVILMSAKDGQPGKFFISRFTRLMPAYWLAVMLTAGATLAFQHPDFNVTLSQVLVNLTMLQTGFGVANVDTVYWTLWLELKFYAVILILSALGWLKHLRHLLLLILVVSLWALAVPFDQQWERWGDPFQLAFPHWWGYFACGCSFYLARRDGVSVYTGLLLLLSLIFVVVQAVVFAQMMGSWFPEPYAPWIFALANAVFFGFFAALIFSRNNPLRRPVFMVIGAMTYPLYLVHQSIGYQWFDVMRDKVNHELLLWATIAAMMLLAWAINRWVEQPLAPKLKRALQRLFDRGSEIILKVKNRADSASTFDNSVDK